VAARWLRNSKGYEWKYAGKFQTYIKVNYNTIYEPEKIIGAFGTQATNLMLMSKERLPPKNSVSNKARIHFIITHHK
jgi:hypothetical protein